MFDRLRHLRKYFGLFFNIGPADAQLNMLKDRLQVWNFRTKHGAVQPLKHTYVWHLSLVKAGDQVFTANLEGPTISLSTGKLDGMQDGRTTAWLASAAQRRQVEGFSQSEQPIALHSDSDRCIAEA